jgi:hypothetical protein
MLPKAASGQTRSFGDVGSMSGLPKSGHGWVRLAEARLALFVGTTCFLKVNPVSATMTAKHVYQVRAGQQ